MSADKPETAETDYRPIRIFNSVETVTLELADGKKLTVRGSPGLYAATIAAYKENEPDLAAVARAVHEQLRRTDPSNEYGQMDWEDFSWLPVAADLTTAAGAAGAPAEDNPQVRELADPKAVSQ